MFSYRQEQNFTHPNYKILHKLNQSPGLCKFMLSYVQSVDKIPIKYNLFPRWFTNLYHFSGGIVNKKTLGPQKKFSGPAFIFPVVQTLRSSSVPKKKKVQKKTIETFWGQVFFSDMLSEIVNISRYTKYPGARQI